MGMIGSFSECSFPILTLRGSLEAIFGLDEGNGILL